MSLAGGDDKPLRKGDRRMTTQRTCSKGDSRTIEELLAARRKENGDMYKAEGTQVIYESRDGEQYTAAECAEATAAVTLLNRSAQANDKGHYTASARLMAKAEQLEGFRWLV